MGLSGNSLAMKKKMMRFGADAAALPSVILSAAAVSAVRNATAHFMTGFSQLSGKFTEVTHTAVKGQADPCHKCKPADSSLSAALETRRRGKDETMV